MVEIYNLIHKVTKYPIIFSKFNSLKLKLTYFGSDHYRGVIMGAMATQIISLTIVYSTVYSDADQRTIKAPRHWPLCKEFTGKRWIQVLAHRASNAENVSIWWRHDAMASRFTSPEENPDRRSILFAIDYCHSNSMEFICCNKYCIDVFGSQLQLRCRGMR